MTAPAALPHPVHLPALLARVSRSFGLSVRLLPAPMRAPVACGYLLARTSDSLADSAQAQAGSAQALALWDQALQAPAPRPAAMMGALAAQLPTLANGLPDPHEARLLGAWREQLALLDQLPAPDQQALRTVLRAILDGQHADLQGDLQAAHAGLQALPDTAALDRYTWQVAGSVGEFWCQMQLAHCGERGDAVVARRYGMALQRLNMARDTAADLARGRCYWPASALAAQGIAPQQLADGVAAGRPPAAMAPLWQAWLDGLVLDLSAGLADALRLRGRRLRLATALPALLGLMTVQALRQAGLQALCQPVKVPRAQVRRLLWPLLLQGASRSALRRAGRAAGATIDA